MREFTRQEIYNKLATGFVDIYFKKKDGTPRQIIATWQEQYLPTKEDSDKAIKQSETTEDQKPKEHVAVWDMTIKDWRSFRFDSVYRIGSEQVTYANK